jgi:hypothetical protein
MPKTDTTEALHNEALDNAIKSIYEFYGPNLSAFFRDVQEEPVARVTPTNYVRLRNEMCQTKRRDKTKTTR